MAQRIQKSCAALWVPEVGELVTRVEVASAFWSLILAYRDREDDPAHFVVIAKLRNGVAYGAGGEFKEHLKRSPDLDRITGVAQEQHRTTKAELRMFALLWLGGAEGFVGWFYSLVRDHPLINVAQRAEIADIITHTLGPLTPLVR